ncbi:AMP-binding protein [Leucobacter sp. GX24907]
MLQATFAPTVAALTADSSIPELLRRRIEEVPERLLIENVAERVTFADFGKRVTQTAELLEGMGIGDGSRVVVSLGNSVAHIALIYTLFDIGAVWIPLNPQLRRDSVAHIIRDSRATHVVAAAVSGASEVLSEEGAEAVGSLSVGTSDAEEGRSEALVYAVQSADTTLGDPRTIAILYTSGTTGPPKGVQVTDRMLRTSAAGCAVVTGARDGDVFYIWEPIFHIGGAQVLFLPLASNIHIALAQRFSVSRFWAEVKRFGATHIHHLGGILQMLLTREPSAEERDHRVRITWGAGATKDVWRSVEQRFGIEVHECYGMTENSSVTTSNSSSFEAGIGRPLPWFEVELLDPETGASADYGEITVRGLRDGLVTPGYLDNDEANARAFFGEWWRTGDLGRRDTNGNLHYVGRVNDSIRVRGENVSAWEVESVFDRMPGVARSAAMGIDGEIGEQDILLFVIPSEEATVDPAGISAWGHQHLAGFQVPRYLQIVDELPMTPSRRVAKKRLQPDAESFLRVPEK